MRKTFLLLAGLCCGLLAFGQVAKKQISLEDIWKNGTFRIKSVPGFNAMKDGRRFTKLNVTDGRASIVTYDLKTGKEEKTLFSAAANTFNGKELQVEDYRFSDDEQKILLLTESQNIYRRSAVHTVYVFDVKSGKVIGINEGQVLHPTFSAKADKLAFVKENNLFVRDLQSGKTVQITTDGARNKIINGNCDWVYEEEFGFTQAYEWSPSGKYLAFYRFDESAVPEYSMTMYDSVYPTQYRYKYPKAGERNSEVQIHFYDVENGKRAQAILGPSTDIYVPRIKWSNSDTALCIFVLNRLQNNLQLMLQSPAGGMAKLIYVEENKAYIDINDDLNFLPDGKSFVFSSEQSGYNQLYVWDWVGKNLQRLTEGSFDIESVVGVDKQSKTVFYTAAEKSPMERKLYAVDFSGGNNRCLTPESGTHAITPCAGFKFFLDKHSSLTEVPVFYLRDAAGKIVRTLEDNSALREKMNQYALGNMRFLSVQGASAQLNAWMITPPGFDSTKKYPVLMYQYSGPNSQMVADKFPAGDYFWHQMLASKGYIILCADGTGTGFRGEAFRKKTYLQLGKAESEDQIAVAQNIGKLPYVDRSRIGIWGWSFGGFMASTCILKGHDVFKAAIAVAPVTNWRYYDNIYTERYMRTPAENADGYDSNAPEKMADKLTGKFLLVHGTGDDNVHFQNSVMLADQLIQNNKPFEDAYYPNKAHGISGGNTRLHLYNRMTEFILRNL